MKNRIVLVFVVGLTSCKQEKQDLALSFKKPDSAAVDYSVGGQNYEGSASWTVESIGDAPRDDSLAVSVRLPGVPDGTGKVRDIKLSIPLQLAGAWDTKDQLHIEYKYGKYSEATKLGVGEFYVSKTKEWQYPTVTGGEKAPDSVPVDGGVSLSGDAGFVEDYIVSVQRYVVRGVDITILRDGTISGTIALYPEAGSLPESFSDATTISSSISGTIGRYYCRGFVEEADAADDNTFLRPLSEPSTACVERFGF
jgi:hypothetical protein